MKLLRVIPTMNPSSGGPCQGIRNITPTLQAKGITTEVVCFDVDRSLYPDSDDFTIHTLGPTIGPYSYCKRLDPWLKDNLFRFDVVIIHGLWLYNSYGTYRTWRSFVNKGHSVPKLYIMPHGMLDPYFQKAKDRKFKAVRNWFFWHLIENRVVNGCDGVLFTCQQELSLAKNAFSAYYPKQEINIGYGIKRPPANSESVSQALLKSFPNLVGVRYFLYLSRIHPKKGLDILIKAYLHLKDMGYKLPHLVIAGPGRESEYGRRLLASVDGMEDIVFVDMVKGLDKWALLYNCDSFVLPSHQENFGIAIVEALACGAPVLISNKVNIWKEIQKFNAGIIENDTFEGTLKQLMSWLELESLDLLRFKEAALSCFENNFEIEKAASVFLIKLDLR